MIENKDIRRLVIPGDGYTGLRDWKFRRDDGTYESTYYDYERDMQCTIDVGNIEEAEEELAQMVIDRKKKEIIQALHNEMSEQNIEVNSQYDICVKLLSAAEFTIILRDKKAGREVTGVWCSPVFLGGEGVRNVINYIFSCMEDNDE